MAGGARRAGAQWRLLKTLVGHICEPITLKRLQIETGSSVTCVRLTRVYLDRCLREVFGIHVAYSRGVGYQLQLVDASEIASLYRNRDRNRHNLRLCVTCAGPDRLGIAALCERFANRMEIHERLTPDEVRVFVSNQFKLAVGDEIMALVVRSNTKGAKHTEV